MLRKITAISVFIKEKEQNALENSWAAQSCLKSDLKLLR